MLKCVAHSIPQQRDEANMTKRERQTGCFAPQAHAVNVARGDLRNEPQSEPRRKIREVKRQTSQKRGDENKDATETTHDGSPPTFATCRFPQHIKTRQAYCRIRNDDDAVPRHGLISAGNIVLDPRKEPRMHSQQKNNAGHACIRNTPQNARPAIVATKQNPQYAGRKRRSCRKGKAPEIQGGMPCVPRRHGGNRVCERGEPYHEGRCDDRADKQRLGE